MLKKLKIYYHNLQAKKPETGYKTVLILSTFAQGFLGPIYMLFLLSQGLDALKANTVNVFFMASIFFFEIPTGVIADLLGRKLAVILAQLFWALAMIVYFFSHSFWQFVSAEILAAIGKSFISGAFDAWLYDHLASEGREDQYQTIYARSAKWARLSVIPAALIAGFIGSRVNLRFPWMIAAIFSFLAFAASLKFLKPDSLKHTLRAQLNEKRGIQRLFYITQNSIKIVFRKPTVWGLILILFVLTLGFQAYNMFWPVIFEHKVGQSSLGIIFAMVTIAIALGFEVASRGIFLKRHPLQSLAIVVLAIGLPMFLGSILPVTGLLLSTFLIHEVARGAFEPIFSAYLNKFIPSPLRATVNSASAMLANLGSVLGLLISGFIAVRFSFLNAWTVSSIVILSILPILFFIFWKRRGFREPELNFHELAEKT